ncbi:amidohydrolase family protein [Methylobacterium persicinum]|uniref:TIM-barrel fold metal-dependent hydrolase n=1 Tax=Methylobacterium persicinum TaxID=374426 RepID=A0ABU0HKW5_9HYPH|nr:amidohydrolase family protein [Methylobacterium persicinum]MDQ0442954.1 putative TIM-barrel fold metal-dependent hydrolase [Methylobacterium persicinum]GJE37298.1 4-sulfomuconolactone hydrolase [Methylobacterium persicinum]
MPEIRDCPAPDPHPAGPTRYAVPPGAVDTHAHVIGLPPAYPLVAERSYTPPAAPAEAYLAMLDATGMAHGVLVQVSVHGTDNRLMLETLRANRQRLRGIAVIPLDLREGELATLKEAGVTGLRLNVLFGGGVGLDKLERYGALAREMGWHLQFLLDARDLPGIVGTLSRLPVPLVFDHMGHMPTSAGVEHPGFQALLGMVRDGAYVKLSGAFRVSVAGPPYADTISFARALNDAGPDRCLWGSDWPHVAAWNGPPKLPVLLDLLADWVPDEDRRRKLFVDNPKGLYEF